MSGAHHERCFPHDAGLLQLGLRAPPFCLPSPASAGGEPESAAAPESAAEHESGAQWPEGEPAEVVEAAGGSSAGVPEEGAGTRPSTLLSSWQSKRKPPVPGDMAAEAAFNAARAAQQAAQPSQWVAAALGCVRGFGAGAEGSGATGRRLPRRGPLALHPTEAGYQAWGAVFTNNFHKTRFLFGIGFWDTVPAAVKGLLYEGCTQGICAAASLLSIIVFHRHPRVRCWLLALGIAAYWLRSLLALALPSSISLCAHSRSGLCQHSCAEYLLLVVGGQGQACMPWAGKRLARMQQRCQHQSRIILALPPPVLPPPELHHPFALPERLDTVDANEGVQGDCASP